MLPFDRNANIFPLILPGMAHSWIPFPFLLYLSILLKLKFTPVRDHFLKCSETKIKWTTGKKVEYPLIMIIKLSTLQQMLLEYLTSKGNYCRNLECCQISPTDKPLTMNRWIHIWKQNISWSVKLAKITQSCVEGGDGVSIATLAISGLGKPQSFSFVAFA